MSSNVTVTTVFCTGGTALVAGRVPLPPMLPPLMRRGYCVFSVMKLTMLGPLHSGLYREVVFEYRSNIFGTSQSVFVVVVVF